MFHNRKNNYRYTLKISKMAHSDAPTLGGLGGLGRSDLSFRNLWLNSHPIDNRKKNQNRI